MSDAAVRELARGAGVATEWTDYAGKMHRVPLDAIRRILAALGLPCASAAEAAQSQQTLCEQTTPPLITVTAGEPAVLPVPRSDRRRGRLVAEDGSAFDVVLRAGAKGLRLRPIEAPGYYTLELGDQRIALAVAPSRCVSVSDLAPGGRIWGLAAQVYGLRSPGDCGIGDMAGVTALARQAAAANADALVLSPLHALFPAAPERFSPYSPSSRLFFNPLHADPHAVFAPEWVRKARAEIEYGAYGPELEAAPLIDWGRAAPLKFALLRRLFAEFCAADRRASRQTGPARSFAQFLAREGDALRQHAIFETLQAARLQADAGAFSWQAWPAQWRDPNSAAVKEFAAENAEEVTFHCFLQWLADRSLAAAQRQALAAGMRVGLVADLAIGTDVAGSHCWAHPDEMLTGLEIGAPPDLFNEHGQNWGLTGFSPRALCQKGFAPFLSPLRACMRHAGGVRIDHAMGLMHLWVIPHGAKASEGAYLSYPLDDLLRLTALESHRHRALVLGEDLGTVPAGFRRRMGRAAIYGMRVLWFERGRNGFSPPRRWTWCAAAMTSTHDLPTVAGWWAGADIDERARCGLIEDAAEQKAARARERRALWRAFAAAGAAESAPPPQAGGQAADAAVRFIAHTSCELALLPLEDALAQVEQPNLPGTIDEHPNWRRRYCGAAGALLSEERVQRRYKPLADRSAAESRSLADGTAGSRDKKSRGKRART